MLSASLLHKTHNPKLQSRLVTFLTPAELHFLSHTDLAFPNGNQVEHVVQECQVTWQQLGYLTLLWFSIKLTKPKTLGYKKKQQQQCDVFIFHDFDVLKTVYTSCLQILNSTLVNTSKSQ